MRIDYTNSEIAPVLVCFVKYQDKFLLMKRSDKVLAYKNLWSSLAGFIDDEKSIEDKIIEEIIEELGLEKENIVRIAKGEIYTYKDAKIGRDWVRYLYVAEISTPNIKLDWEHTDYKWISPEEIKNYETTPGFAEDFAKVKSI